MSKLMKKEIAIEANKNQNETETQHPLDRDIDYVSTASKVPCDVGQSAFIPYWEKRGGELVFEIDEYEVASVAGCGDIWICTIRDKNGVESNTLEPNVDVFFSVKDAERKIASLKKTEDQKKMSKWRHKVITDIGN